MSMVRVLSGAKIYKHHDVLCALDTSSLLESDEKQLLFWSDDPLESPQGDLFDNILTKAVWMNVFNRLMPSLELTGHETVLELGGGHCWASTLIKRDHPGCYVVASDLSPHAVQFVEKYEALSGVLVDEKWALSCRQIPFDENQFDRIFTFAAFHHFGEGESNFGGALREMVRVLRPKGKIVLLYESATPRWTYRWYRERQDRKRNADGSRRSVDEDVIILSNIRRICEELNCRFEAQYLTSYEERAGITETVYYYALTRLKPLRSLLPCTVNMTIEKL